MALALANVAIMGQLEPQDARERATAAATQALRCDPRLGLAHTAAAMTAMLFDWDWDRAEREFRTGISLDPHSSDAHAYFAQFLCAVGRPDEALPLADAAHRLDPLGLWSNFVLGWALFRARRHDESIRRLRDVLELYPHFAFAHLFVAENLLARGAHPEAVEACKTALGILPEDQLLLGLTACVSGLSGERELARRLLERLEAIARSRYVCPGHLAAAHVGVGERERAFEYWWRSELREIPRFTDAHRAIDLNA